MLVKHYRHLLIALKILLRHILILGVTLVGFLLISSTVYANDIPKILNDKDAGLYQQIFKLQEEGQWKKAGTLLKKVENQLLLGHVKYQRYMHPNSYRASYPELHLWMKAYSDHPGARRLYKLAVTRHLSDWKQTPKPVRGGYLGGSGPGQPFYLSRPHKSKRKRSAKTVNEVKHAHRVIRRHLYRGQPTKAAEYLKQDKIGRLLDRTEYDILRSKIAHSFFLYAKDELAVEFAEASLKKSSRYVPLSDWTAGLALWRMGTLGRAADHFSTLSKTKKISGWTASRANWWASRAYLKLGKPTKAITYLRRAASYPRTFYGLLALRQLGVKKPFVWDLPKLKQADINWLVKIPSARRAIALSEAGQFYRAEQELRSAFPSANPKLAPLLLALSERIGAPSVAMRMGLYLWEKKKKTWDAALYPHPLWHPKSGFKVDRALLFAFMRQESGFNSRAKSGVGAKGLMQLMPRTAAYLAKDPSLRNRKDIKLFNPSYNLDLGQKYLEYLMKNNDVGTNLFHLTIAYNGGPGNLVKWKSRTKGGGDPLFFIEAMQSRETRSFIKRVLTNFWIYRHRFGQDLPALDNLAEGKWPQYKPLDTKNRKVADSDRN
ncbi:MAG: lytic transglycosylase domain-containing protein [Sneathiella sp.]|nr:lytic transglycosylase domain-containing protein [Sneathiella sp.]